MAEGGILPPILLELKAKGSEVHAELAKVKTEVGELAEHAEKSGSTFNKGFQTMAGAGKALTFGLAGAVTAVGGFAIEAAVAGEKVDAQLATAIKNAGGSMEELEPKIGALDGKMRQFGYTNEETNGALARLTTATHDPEKAMEAMSVAADLARSRNIPLATATDLVAKAMAGQTGALKRMGIDLPVAAGGAMKVKAAQDALAKAQQGVNDVLAKYPDAEDKASKGHAAYEKATEAVKAAQEKLTETQKSGGDILEALEGRVKGAASAYGDTLAGKMAAAKAQVDNIGEALGKRLIPIITGALGAASSFVNWLTSHTPVLYTLAAVIGTVVVAAITAYIASLVTAGVQSVIQFAKMAASAATWIAEQAVQLAESAAGFVAWGVEHAAMAAAFIAENIAMAAAATAAFIAENAATLGIVAVIGLIVAAIVYVATHWSQCWGAIKAAAAAVWDWLQGAWSWIKGVFFDGLHIGLAALQAVWGAVWGAIKGAFSAVVDFFKDAWNWIKTTFLLALQAQIKVTEQVWSAVWSGIKGAVSAVWDFLKSVWSWISSIFGGAIHGVLSGLGSIFSTIWGGIKSVVSGVWGFLQGVWSGIQGAIQGVGKVIQWLGGIWSDIWGGIKSAVQTVWNFIKPIFDAIGKAISMVSDGIGMVKGAASAVGNFLGFDNGGVVPGPKGKPMLAVVHGGEYVLSNDMQDGKQEPTGLNMAGAASANGYTPASGGSLSQQALTGGASAQSSGGGQTVNVFAQTNASPTHIASSVGWALRAMA